jgi:hypothetical protein
MWNVALAALRLIGLAERGGRNLAALNRLQLSIVRGLHQRPSAADHGHAVVFAEGWRTGDMT